MAENPLATPTDNDMLKVNETLELWPLLYEINILEFLIWHNLFSSYNILSFTKKKTNK